MSRTAALFLVLTVVLALAACNLPGDRTPTMDGADALRTVAAKTVDAMSTELATNPPATRTLSPTAPAPGSPTQTLTPAQVTPVSATATQPGSTSIPCDQAVFLRDVTIPDGTLFFPGTSFIKTWEIKNTGSCTWDSTYSLVFGDEGDQMSGAVTQPLVSSGSVTPGDKVSIAVTLKAPDATGDYKGFWKLRNPNGNVFFGVNKGIWASIKVVKFDKKFYLADNTCNAVWRISADLSIPPLACPGKEGDARGSVIRTDNPKFYSYEDNEPAIQVEPQQITDGFIVGALPPVLLPDNSMLRTVVGCGAKADKCDARVVITAQVLGGDEITLKDFRQKASDDLSVVNIDLAAQGLAGKSVIFRLYARANGSPVQDKIIFLGPVIELK